MNTQVKIYLLNTDTGKLIKLHELGGIVGLSEEVRHYPCYNRFDSYNNDIITDKYISITMPIFRLFDYTEYNAARIVAGNEIDMTLTFTHIIPSKIETELIELRLQDFCKVEDESLTNKFILASMLN